MAKATETTKRIPSVTTEYNDALGQLDVVFADGDKFVITIADLSPEIIEQAIRHGLNAKLVDAAAMSRNPDTGASATVADKKAAVIEVAERLVNGEWNKRREAGEGEGTLLLAAMMRVYPTTERAVLEAKIEAWSPYERKVVRLNPRIAAAITAIQVERAERKGINSDDLLDDLA